MITCTQDYKLWTFLAKILTLKGNMTHRLSNKHIRVNIALLKVLKGILTSTKLYNKRMLLLRELKNCKFLIKYRISRTICTILSKRKLKITT